MHNILLILKHEYLTRVSKKSFIIMTLLGPILIGLFYGSIALISVSQFNDSEVEHIGIYDPNNALNHEIIFNKSYNFNYVTDMEQTKSLIQNDSLSAMLVIHNKRGDSMELIAKKSFSITDRGILKDLITDKLFQNNLKSNGLSKERLDSMKVNVKLTDNLLSGKSSASVAKSGVGYIGAIIIYMFIFLYGVMIMRGVTEEKNNRIVEIIISSVKPFQLMMGKILGVAMVGLTQFIAWITLSGLLVLVLTVAIGFNQMDTVHADTINSQIQGAENGMQSGLTMEIQNFFGDLFSLDFVKIIVGFIIFFFGGFLLYSAIFAAIGSAVDSDAETQQFMFPVSMPLIFGLIIAQIAVIKDPNSSLAYWCSIIPFTSPVVMMVRLPFDVSWFQIAISAIILFSTFIVIVWFASKIYRIGILSYGQKASYKQMFRWMMTK